MKLYTFDPAPNPLRLQLFLDYKGIQIETEQVNLMKREQMSETYTAINPLGTVPALVTDEGVVLTDVVGIVRYLEELHPEKPLLGTTALDKGIVASWSQRLFLTLLLPVADVFRNTNPAFKGRAQPGPLDVEQMPALAERANPRIEYTLNELDAHLAESPWLCGDTLTFPDLELHAMIGFMGWIERSLPDNCAHLKAWHERLQAAIS